jgi:hypothetical protein
MKDYFTNSRAPRYSLTFALPLLLLYEGLSLLLTGSAVEGVRNGADVLLKSMFVAMGGRDGILLFGALLLGGGAFLVARDIRKAAEGIQGRVFGLMMLESTLYASVFGFVAGWLTAALLPRSALLSLQGMQSLDLPTQLVVSLGAGLYEELAFRVILTGGLLAALRTLTPMPKPAAAAVAIVVSALIFSAFHYVGSLGDTFTVASFTFRAVAGVLFSALYVVRGFGIAAWTHALYDLGLSLLIAGGS